MYGIFTYIYHKHQPNVGKDTSPMDGMGIVGHPLGPWLPQGNGALCAQQRHKGERMVEQKPGKPCYDNSRMAMYIMYTYICVYIYIQI